jgi:hypothetical protein
MLPSKESTVPQHTGRSFGRALNATEAKPTYLPHKDRRRTLFVAFWNSRQVGRTQAMVKLPPGKFSKLAFETKVVELVMM